nr:hypothetical protein [Candidatus Freyrarchaeum guaymaensis]
MVEYRIPASCRGIMLIRFDYALGPVAEELFPKNFIPNELLWSMSLDIWMTLGTKSMEKGYNTIVFLRDVGMFAYVVSGGSRGEEETPYIITAFFEPKDIGVVWNVKDEILRVLSGKLSSIRDGKESENAVREAYDEITRILASGRLAIEEYVDTFMEQTVEFVLKLIKQVSNLSKEVADRLKPLLREYVTVLVRTASKIGSKKVVESVLSLNTLLSERG